MDLDLARQSKEQDIEAHPDLAMKQFGIDFFIQTVSNPDCISTMVKNKTLYLKIFF